MNTNHERKRFLPGKADDRNTRFLEEPVARIPFLEKRSSDLRAASFGFIIDDCFD
jgi:hypothetical protein